MESESIEGVFRELSLVAGSSVDPEIIIRVHRFDPSSDVISFDMASFPEQSALAIPSEQSHPALDPSAVFDAMRDINRFLEERATFNL